MSSFSIRDNLTIENGKSLKWLDATGTNRKDILTLDGFNVVKMNSAGSDIYINNSVNSTTWVNIGNNNNVIIGSKLGIGTSTVSGVLSLPSNSLISSDSTNGTLTLSAGRDSSVSSSKIVIGANGTGGNLDLYTGSTSGSGIRFYSGASSLKRFHIYDSGLFNFTPDGSTISVSLDTSSLTAAIPLNLQNTTNSITTSTGALILSGGASIMRNLSIGGSTTLFNTTDSIGIGSGGSLTILGGASVSKRLFTNTLSIGDISNEFSGSFSGNNNVTTASDITGLSFSTTDTRSFIVTMSIVILASSSLYSQVTIEGIYKNGTWEIFTSSLGDQTNITFSITPSGQLRYTSSNYVSWISTTFRWTAKIINQTGTHNPPTLPTSGSQTITGPLIITSTDNAVSGSSGALTVAGGVGIAGDLIVGGNVLSNIWKTQIATSSFSVTSSHKNYLFLVNSTSSNLTISLISAALAGVNYMVGFTKTDDLNSTIQIIPSSGTIENIYSNYLLSNLNDSVTFISDGSTWRILQTRTPVFYNIYSVPGTYFFTIPNPITRVFVCVFGAGGGGGSGTDGISSGNGGGGGGYCEGVISVAPGGTLTITVGAGGTAGISGESSSVGDLVATGGGAGGSNSSGTWSSNGSAGSGSGGIINRSGGTGGQAPSQIIGGGGGGGAAGYSGSGVNGSGLIGGNGSAGYGGTGAVAVDTEGSSIRINNFFREGGGGASGNLITALGLNGGFPGGGGSGASDGSGGNGGDGCVIIYY